MPTHAGPNTKGQENLVFGYDLGDVSNSYKGEPTTNHGPADFGDWGTESTAKRLATGNTYKGQPTYNCRTVVGESWRGVEKTISGLRTAAGSSGTVTMSCMVRNNNPSAYNMYAYIGHDFGSTRSIPANSGWRKVQWTVNQSSMNNDYVEFRPYTNNANVYLEMTMPMVEVNKGHATQFTSGTRSVSGSLIDVTGNSTIDLTNVSFDSNAQMTFDGTSDYATIDHNTVMRDTDSLVIEAVFQVYSQFGYYGGIIGKGTSDANEEYFLGIYPSGNKIYFDVGQGSGPYVNASQTINSNQYYHVVAMHERAGGTSTCSIYVNGEFVSNTTSGATNSVNTNTTDITIGSRWSDGSNSLNGDIPFLKMYNRILTTSEIKANYNAIKGRFNI